MAWFCRYEKSYMHRDVVTHVAVSPADYFITGSADGNLSRSRLCIVPYSVCDTSGLCLCGSLLACGSMC